MYDFIDYAYLCRCVNYFRENKMNVSKSLLIILVALTMSGFEGMAQSAHYLMLVEKADSAIAECRWLDADSLMQCALRCEPGNPTNILLMSNMGIVRQNAGRDSLALDILNEAHRMAPVSVTVLSNRARVLQSMGRNAEAFYDYTRILELDSTVIEPRFMHAMMSLAGGDIVTAELDCGALQRHAPEASLTLEALASLYTATNRPLDAIVQYTKLINRVHDVEYYRGRAACYLLTDQLNEASADIAEWLSITPDDGEAYIYRAYLNKRRYRNADAEADVQMARKLGIDPVRADMLR